MAPSSTTAATGRLTRASSRTSTTSASTTKGAAKTVSATKPKTETTKKATATGKGSKRQAASKAGARKRVKREEYDEDEEEEEEEREASEAEEDNDQEDYKDEDEENDEDSDADDFEDSSYGKSRTRQTTKAAPSSKKSKSTATKKTSAAKPSRSSSNPDLQPAGYKKFKVSPVVIPRPKKPAADAIQPETLEFIRDLKLNNDREYMDQNLERCQQAKADFLDFIRMVKEGLLEADPDILNVEPKDSMMRIYRDIRFSNDKSPYKRSFSCFFSKGGKKSIAAGYFFGVSSEGETFAGCGKWDPSGPVLVRIRQGIVNHSERFEEILSTDAIKKITGGKTGLDALRPGSSQLKTGPAGFDKNHPMIEYLKRKCFAIGRTFTDKEVVSEGFLEEVLQTFDACVDLVHILNDWIG